MEREDIKKYTKYKIMYPDRYSGRVAEARGIDQYGDVTLEFKNGVQVVYHAGWLDEIEAKK